MNLCIGSNSAAPKNGPVFVSSFVVAKSGSTWTVNISH